MTISLIFIADNDGPLLELPGLLETQEDIPLLLPGLAVSDVDYGEPGGEM